MRTFETVRDVLHNAREFHRCAAEFYRQLHQQADDDRVAMLLTYLFEHEEKMDASLGAYEQHAAANILDTWMQYTLEESPRQFIGQLEVANVMTVEGIAQLGQTIDAHLAEVFKELAETAGTDELREVFQNLMAMEVKEKHGLTRASNGLIWDM